MDNLYIIGAGGFGKEVAALVERINEVKPTWNLKGFLDDNADKLGTQWFDYPIIGGVDHLANTRETIYVVCAIGPAKIRRTIIRKVSKYTNVKFATLIDPSVIQTRNVSIGEGSIIWIGSILSVHSRS